MSNGKRLQAIFPEMKEGAFLTYGNKMSDLCAGRMNYWQMLFAEDKPDYGKKREIK